VSLIVGQIDEAALVMARIHQVRERHFEDVGHFRRVRTQGEPGAQDADHRRDEKTGAGTIFGQTTEHLDARTLDADFLVRLAQGRIDRRGVARFETAARKCHLPRVIAQMVRALGQQKGIAVRMLDDRHQDRRRTRFGLVAAKAVVELFGLPRRRMCQPFAQRGHAQALERHRSKPVMRFLHRERTRIETRARRCLHLIRLRRPCLQRFRSFIVRRRRRRNDAPWIRNLRHR